ncbi:hypothetical protein ACLKA6_004806 [Drosophila palustris]
MITTPTLSPTGTQDTLKPNPKTVHHNNDGSFKQTDRASDASGQVDDGTSLQSTQNTVAIKIDFYTFQPTQMDNWPSGNCSSSYLNILSMFVRSRSRAWLTIFVLMPCPVQMFIQDKTEQNEMPLPR